VEAVIDTERPAMAGKPARQLQMRYAYTLTHRNRHHSDPARRFDVDMEMQAPLLMHFKLEDGEFSYMSAKGVWIKKALPAQAQKYMAELSERHAGNAKELREQFQIRRLKSKDNFWGTKKGLELIPKGRSKMYARRVETVDVASGQPIDIELYDAKGNRTVHMKVHKLGNHNGVMLPDDMESESIGGVGKIIQRTRLSRVEVETE
jgi:hypothetical protein